MLTQDKRDEAEAFIDKVIAPTKAIDTARQRHHVARAKFRQDELALVRRELAASGIDVARLDKLADDRSSLRAKYFEEAGLGDLGFVAIVDAGSLSLPADPNETVIDEVTFIRSFADQGAVEDLQIAPGDNWARYRLKGSSYEGVGRLSFFTLWQSPLDSIALITPRVSLSVNANLAADVSGSGIGDWFGITSTTKATVHARTTVWGMSVQERTVVDDRDIGEISVTSGFLGDDASRSITFDDVLLGSAAVVLPRAWMLFEVELLTDWDLLDGSIHFDAAGGSRRVTMERLVIAGVGTQPPPSIMLSVATSPIAGGAIANLNWSGANTSQVEIYQNGTRVGTVANSGVFGISVTSGSYVFRVCETGATRCSNDVTVTVP